MSGQDLINRMEAIQACQVGPSDEWSKATKSGYSQAATDCALNILRIDAAIDPAYTYAKHLAETIFARSMFVVPEWSVLDDTLGVLTQIDRMVATLLDRPDPAAIREAALREAAAVAVRDGGWRHYHMARKTSDAILALIDKPAPDHSATPGNMIDQDTIARAICREQCAVYGEPPCYQVGPWPCTNCDEPGCQALAASVARALIDKGTG